DNRVLITDASIANDSLKVTVSELIPSEGYIELAQTITHKTYGSKTFTTTIPVKVIDNTVTGVENVSATGKRIRYDGQSLIVENCANEMIAVYDIAGTLITTFEATHDVFVKALNLQSGIYIVIAKDHAQKISVK
ncbi:MAG: T9SS type A sorting domain-containing protein, partial [Muribaculaceae bacterium]|nr:T9SS type A sorting domain-containing protein [Muribaculaceae bacterium]